MCNDCMSCVSCHRMWHRARFPCRSAGGGTARCGASARIFKVARRAAEGRSSLPECDCLYPSVEPPVLCVVVCGHTLGGPLPAPLWERARRLRGVQHPLHAIRQCLHPALKPRALPEAAARACRPTVRLTRHWARTKLPISCRRRLDVLPGGAAARLWLRFAAGPAAAFAAGPALRAPGYNAPFCCYPTCSS